MKKIWLFSLCILLSGCLSVTPDAVIEASRFNPLEMEPADLGAALGVPDAIRLSPGDAKIVMTYKLKGAAEPLVDELFLLDVKPAQTGVDGLPPALAGETLYIARLTEEDVARMRDVQLRIRTLKAKGAQGQGSFSVGISGGCALRLPVKTLPVRTFLKTRSDGAYFPSTRRTDFFKLLPPAEQSRLRAELKTCGSS